MSTATKDGLNNEQPVLEVRKISKSFPGVRALNNVDLRIWPGEVHALMGENGAGNVLAAGMTFVILTGGIDLAVGSVLGLSAVIAVAPIPPSGAPPIWRPKEPRLLTARSTLLGSGMVTLDPFPGW